VLCCVVAACHADPPTSANPPVSPGIGQPNDPGGRIALRPMALATFDGSGQVVHPDIIPAERPGEVARLVITPYPWGNARYENPSLFEGDGRDEWAVSNGVTNPVVKPDRGYQSDPDALWLADRHELWLYYRRVDEENEIVLSRSSDGVRWSEPRVVVSAPNHQAVSPTVVRRSDTAWLMWTVNSGKDGCTSATTTVELRKSSDGLTWGLPVTVSLSQPVVYAWHIDVQWIPSLREYWALFNAKVAGSCTTDALYVATSADGAAWRTYRSPVLRRGATPELEDVVYRATFAYDPRTDLVSLWHTGARYTSHGYEWRGVFERRRRADLFDAVSLVETGAYIAPSGAPPLTNATAP
jgi:hypothetical protein